MNCLKSLKKNVQRLQEPYYMHTCIGSWENGNCYPPHQDAVYASPHGGHQKFQWEGGPRGGNFQGGGDRFSRTFFPGTLKLELLFLLMILHLKVIAECFFHSLPVWYSLHVYVIGSWILPVIQLIALYFTKIIIVVWFHCVMVMSY